MTFKTKIRLLTLILAIITVFSMTSCSKKGGDMEDGGSEETKVSVDPKPNKENEAAKFAEEYYNWIKYKAFSVENGFVSAMNKTEFPAELEAYFSAFGDKRDKHYADIFCPVEIINATLSVSQYESGKNFIHEVSQLSKNKNWIYAIKMSIAGKESSYELNLSEKTKAVKLNKYDDNGNLVSFHEVVLTNDGYIAVNRGDKSSGSWTSLQLLFKADEGYCTMTSGGNEAPASVYETSLPAGFAGKK